MASLAAFASPVLGESARKRINFSCTKDANQSSVLLAIGGLSEQTTGAIMRFHNAVLEWQASIPFDGTTVYGRAD